MMTEVKLLTRDGGYVTTVVVPHFRLMPEGILWGTRTFFRGADGQYREGLLYDVPILESK